ncbi:MAG TPA: hypothetical protein VI873_00735 [Candidatus Peribacteraceae bacterium]|nr:hypothetical protein [Candidatus Peribacteraceae bacterium]
MALRTMRALGTLARKQLKHPFKWIERVLLGTFLVCRAWLFYVTAGVPAGFDAGAHIEMLTKLSWMHPDIAVRDSFYSYHPPMGFLMARTFHLLGLTPEVSVQIVSALFAILTFFFLRMTLQYLKILYTPASIVFLYLGAAIPLQIYLATSINLESIILSATAGILYCSVRLFWGKQPLAEQIPKHPATFATYATATVSLLLFAMMTKFSGLLLFAIPPLVAALGKINRRWIQKMIVTCALCFIGLGIAFPYYYLRYEKTEGTFFPYNGDWIIEGAMQESRTKRDENPVRFFVDAFEVSPVHLKDGLRFHDSEVIRLLDVWRDFWLKDQFLGGTSKMAEIVGIGYMWSFPMLILIALPTYLLGLHTRSMWNKLGGVILAFATLQFIAMVLYVYKNPFPGWGPNKGMYIAAAMWGIAFLIGTLFGEGPLPLWRRLLLLLLLLTFVIVNHVIPVYS